MADDQTEKDPREPLSLRAFAESLYHSERADNYFKFLKNMSEDDLTHFMQRLLQQVGDAIDDRDTSRLTDFVQQEQAHAYIPGQTVSAIRPDFPDSPFTPLRKPLNEATIALFTSGAIYRDNQEPYYLLTSRMNRRYKMYARRLNGFPRCVLFQPIHQ